MCSEYTLRTSTGVINETIGEIRSEREDWDLHVRIYSEAPVLVFTDGSLIIRTMKFSLMPPGTKYSTFNARLMNFDERKNRMVRIYEKPTWRDPFRHRRCLIPMTGFLEPIYLGEHAGQVLEMTRVDGKLMFIPGLFHETVDAKTGEIYEGFAPILHTPSPYVLKIGHHRQVVELGPNEGKKWLMTKDLSSEEAFELLLKERQTSEITHKVFRSLAKGWERRVEDHRKKRERELEIADRLK